MVISLRTGMEKSRDELIEKLVSIQYERNDIDFSRNKFRVRGDVVEIFPVYSNENGIRVEFFGDEIDRISEINALTGQVKSVLSHAAIYPASHYVIAPDKMEKSIANIYGEMLEREKYFPSSCKYINPQVSFAKQKVWFSITMAIFSVKPQEGLSE
jgi:excinuclease ABC subunit B